jgi:metal-responsive CopG/Arc/MetJ family transcriptional regulator
MMAKAMNILLSEELMEKISEMSKEDGISKAEFIRRALNDYVQVKEKGRRRREIQKAIAIQDQLRTQTPPWNGLEEIRKLREGR